MHIRLVVSLWQGGGQEWMQRNSLCRTTLRMTVTALDPKIGGSRIVPIAEPIKLQEAEESAVYRLYSATTFVCLDLGPKTSCPLLRVQPLPHSAACYHVRTILSNTSRRSGNASFSIPCDVLKDRGIGIWAQVTSSVTVGATTCCSYMPVPAVITQSDCTSMSARVGCTIGNSGTVAPTLPPYRRERAL